MLTAQWRASSASSNSRTPRTTSFRYQTTVLTGRAGTRTHRASEPSGRVQRQSTSGAAMRRGAQGVGRPPLTAHVGLLSSGAGRNCSRSAPDALRQSHRQGTQTCIEGRPDRVLLDTALAEESTEPCPPRRTTPPTRRTSRHLPVAFRSRIRCPRLGRVGPCARALQEESTAQHRRRI